MKGGDLYRKKFLILREITNAIATTDDICIVSNLILDLSINFTNAEAGSLLLVNDQDELHILASKGLDLETVKDYRAKVGEGIAGTVAKDRVPVLVEDIDTDERFKGNMHDRHKTRSFISCPLISKNRLLGVLNINDKRDGGTFTDLEFALIKTVANHAALAIENASLMSSLKAKASELEALNKKLLEMDTVKTDVLNHLSHALRTPLSSIKGAVYYLQESKTVSRPEQREFHNIIAGESAKLGSIIDNLLMFIKHEDETKLINRSVVDVAKVLDEALNSNMVKDALAPKKLKLVMDIKAPRPDVVADKVRMSQFFINLVEGLVPHVETKDELKVWVREDDFVNVGFDLPREMPEPAMSLFSSSMCILKSDQPDEDIKLCLAMKVAELHRWGLAVKNDRGAFHVSISMPRSAKEKIEYTISSIMDLFVELISVFLGVNGCSIMLLDELTGDLVVRSAKGLSAHIIRRRRTRLSRGEMVSGWVVREGRPLIVDNAEEYDHFGKSGRQHTSKSIICVPLKINGKVAGVLNLYSKADGSNFTPKDLQIASALSDRVSHFIERFHANECAESCMRHFTESITELIGAAKKYQKTVSYTDLMLRVLDALGASDVEKQLGCYVSLIYDLGLKSIDENVLTKKKLLPSETTSLKMHPYSTIFLLDDFEFSGEAKKAILHHHERFDGSGYPQRLKGDAIPFISRVLSVVDSFCAMTSESAYRQRLSAEAALAEIRNGSGTIYDERVAEALEEVVLASQTSGDAHEA